MISILGSTHLSCVKAGFTVLHQSAVCHGSLPYVSKTSHDPAVQSRHPAPGHLVFIRTPASRRWYDCIMDLCPLRLTDELEALTQLFAAASIPLYVYLTSLVHTMMRLFGLSIVRPFYQLILCITAYVSVCGCFQFCLHRFFFMCLCFCWLFHM